MNLGFIGTGRITAAIVEGLCAAPLPPRRILVSPRNAHRAAALAGQFGPVEVAQDNQCVVAASDVVFLAVRPESNAEIAAGLRFRPEQLVVSVIGTLRYEEARALVAPARRVVRAGPLPSVAPRLGPIAYFPAESEATEIFTRIGTPVPLPDERAFHLLWSFVCLVAPFYTLLDEAWRWSVATGADPAAAGAFLPALFQALSHRAEVVGKESFEGLIEEAATPGGLNEHALAELRDRGFYEALRGTLDAVFARMEAQPGN